MSRWRVRVRSVPKRDAADGINQDYAAALVGRAPDGHTFVRASVADGASSAFRPEGWAKVLADAYTSAVVNPHLSSRELASRLRPLAREWTKINPPKSGAWYHRAHASQGSYAALLGVTIRRKGAKWRWKAIAVGDVNLFQIDDSLATTRVFPVTQASEFARDPLLISTHGEANAAWVGRRLRATGELPARSALCLASDGLARWVLERREAGESPFERLHEAIASARAFEVFVEGERQTRSMVNDDTTVLWVDRP